jgi:hypothetical protein
MQDAAVDLPVDNGPETTVFVRKIIVKRLPGDAQLMAQVRNADRRIGPLQEVGVQTLFNLLLAAVGGRGTGDLGNFHYFLQFWVKFLMLYTIMYIIQERWPKVNSQKFKQVIQK